MILIDFLCQQGALYILVVCHHPTVATIATVADTTTTSPSALVRQGPVVSVNKAPPTSEVMVFSPGFNAVTPKQTEPPPNARGTSFGFPFVPAVVVVVGRYFYLGLPQVP